MSGALESDLDLDYLDRAAERIVNDFERTDEIEFRDVLAMGRWICDLTAEVRRLLVPARVVSSSERPEQEQDSGGHALGDVSRAEDSE